MNTMATRPHQVPEQTSAVRLAARLKLYLKLPPTYLPFSFPSSVVLFNAAFLCYKQICTGLEPYLSDLPDRHFAYEKFGVLFNLPSSCSLLGVRSDRSAREGSARFRVYNWHQKSRTSLSSHIASVRKMIVLVSYGRAVVKIVCAEA